MTQRHIRKITRALRTQRSRTERGALAGARRAQRRCVDLMAAALGVGADVPLLVRDQLVDAVPWSRFARNMQALAINNGRPDLAKGWVL